MEGTTVKAITWDAPRVAAKASKWPKVFQTLLVSRVWSLTLRCVSDHRLDGIVSGAPAVAFNDLTSFSGRLTQLAGFDNTSSTFIDLAHWRLINKHILSQCDALDGAQDGIIEDPDLCRPIFSDLLCASNNTNTSTCLNVGQVERVQAIYSPFYGLEGELLYPRMQPGSEIAAFPLLYSGKPFPYTTDWYRYAIYGNSSWSPYNQSLADAEYARKLNPFGVSAWNGNLSAFRERGGKILTYHGMQDQLISSDNSVSPPAFPTRHTLNSRVVNDISLIYIQARYYSLVSNTMGLASSDLDSFLRYFRISGMSHCRGGPGATDIGNFYYGRANPTAEDNVLLAVMAWTENGTAPEYIRGYSLPANGPVFSRQHCKYPARNAHIGPGNYTDENSWACVTNAADGLLMQT